MASLAELPELVGFFSYSRRDDERAGGNLSALRKRILDELGLQLGRDLRLWQDTAAIPHGSLWQDEIDRAIAESVFFIPIVTPSAIGSEHCKYEFDAFLARESVLARRNLVFPILYINVPGLETAEGRQQNEVLQIIHARQYFNWTTMRHRDLTSADAAEKIEQFCGNICGALRQQWMSPDERRRREEIEAQRRRADEEAQLAAQADAARQLEARQAAEAEAKRRREQEEKLAAERRRAQADADEENRRKAQQRADEADARRRQDEQDRLAAQKAQRERAVPRENRGGPGPIEVPNPPPPKPVDTIGVAARFAPANLRGTLEGAALPVLLLILWQIVSSWTGAIFFPAPTTILSSLFGGAWGTVATDAAASVVRFVVGFLLGGIAWFGFERLVAISDRAGAMLRPLFRLLCGIPSLAFIPLVLFEFGVGPGAPIAGFIATFLALTTECMPGVGQARSLDKSPAVPAPGFAAAATAGFSAVLVTEMVYSDIGLGHAAAQFEQTYEIAEILSVILIAAILGGGIRLLAGLLDRLTARHAAAVAADARTADARRPGADPGNFAWSVVRGGLLPILIILVWQFASSSGMVSSFALPSPVQIAAEWLDLLAGGPLVGNAARTVGQLVAAVLLSLVLVLPILLAIHSRAGAWLRPLFLILGAVPPVMWIMPAAPWFGIGSASDIFAATAGASLAVLIRLLPLPISGSGPEGAAGLRLPSLQAGVRQTVKMVFGLVIAAELVAGFNGLGFLMGKAAGAGNARALFACLLTVAVIGIIADMIVDLVFRVAAARRP